MGLREEENTGFIAGIHLQPSIFHKNGNVFHKEAALQTSVNLILKTLGKRL